MGLINMKKVVVIGIAGGSASGKTSIANKLRIGFEGASVQIIKMDDYYNDLSHLELEQRYQVNYDHPLAFDMDLLVAHIQSLAQRQTVLKPLYDFVLHNRMEETELINPTDVLIIEGLFCLEEPKIRDLLDIKVFVDTPADIRFIRRLNRDVKKRGRTLDQVVSQYTNTVRVMHDLFVEPSKRYADIIIPEGGENVVAIDILMTKISSILGVK